MNDRFKAGQRVRHHIDGRRGVIASVDEDAGQVSADVVTYTVKWNDAPIPESLVRQAELTAG